MPGELGATVLVGLGVAVAATVGTGVVVGGKLEPVGAVAAAAVERVDCYPIVISGVVVVVVLTVACAFVGPAFAVPESSFVQWKLVVVVVEPDSDGVVVAAAEAAVVAEPSERALLSSGLER